MATTNSDVASVDVLIVGAGPVGLFLANECQRRGLDYRLVETRPAQSLHSKALAIFPRTLEILDMAGLVAPFMAVANPVTSVAIQSHGRPLAQLRFAPEESPYPLIAMVPQNITEQLLVEQLTSRGGRVEYGTTFVSAVAEADGVRAILEQNGERRPLTASFVVGCDGAHSAVRHLLDLPFEGAQYDDLFMLADVDSNDTLPADELLLCPNELGPLAIFPMSATRRRIVATVQAADGPTPTLALVRRILAERGPARFEARELHWSSYFRIHHRHAARLREGRMFIAGDAAHIHSPFGGQGMNTGLHDVWNLAWKLDLVVRGLGNEPLLESYAAERLPVIRQVIETTHLLTRAMGTPNHFAQWLRDIVIPMVSRLAPFQHALVQRLSELGIAYHGSPIVEGAGERYLDDSLRGGRGIASRFLLIVDEQAPPPVKAAAGQLADVFRDVVELRWSEQPRVVMVRPDGYLACSGSSRDGLETLESARVLLARQTTPDAIAGRRRVAPRMVPA